MILIIDNYDSFVYNLYQEIGKINNDIKIVRNDEFSVDEIMVLQPSHIVISPGPGHPKDAGICEELVKKVENHIPVLGICLGHQGICEAFGGDIVHSNKLVHGKKSEIEIDTHEDLFSGLEKNISVARYHSLMVDEKTLPEEVKVIGRTKDGEVMAVKHSLFPIYGLQFHPESILTDDGDRILKNFLSMTRRQHDKDCNSQSH